MIYDRAAHRMVIRRTRRVLPGHYENRKLWLVPTDTINPFEDTLKFYKARTPNTRSMEFGREASLSVYNMQIGRGTLMRPALVLDFTFEL